MLIIPDTPPIRRRRAIARRVLSSTFACLLAWTACRSSCAVDVNFSAAADNNLFNKLQDFHTTPVPWSATAGVGGGGGLSITGSHYSTYAASSFNASQVGAALEASAFFRTHPVATTLPIYAEVYLVRDANTFGDFAADSFQTIVSEGPSGLELYALSQKNAGFSSAWTANFPAGLIQPNRWYQIKTQFQNIGLGYFNWNIQVNDYGSSGAQFLSSVAETRSKRFDHNRYFEDTSLYGGFYANSESAVAVDNFSVSTGVAPIPTTSLEINPSIDVELQVGGSTTTLIEGGQGIRLGNNPSAPGSPASEALMEFPLAALPDRARVLSASLVLSPNVALGSPQLRVRGYAGDGLASTSDATTTGLTLNPGFTIDSGSYSIPLNAETLAPFLSTPSHLGVRIANLVPNDSMFLNALEYPFQVSKTKLVLNYYVPPSGDFDFDADVDRSDLMMWRRTFGETLTAEADADGDLDSDGRDFLAWQRNFGAGITTYAAGDPVPEPAGCALTALAALAVTGRRRSLTQ